MILYEVTLGVEPSLESRVEDYMRSRHIPAIWATGCFRDIHFYRAASGTFRTAYAADTEAELERYLRDHAPTMRAEFLAEFPTGAALTREVWRERQRWGEG
jgi:hypothetical protein